MIVKNEERVLERCLRSIRPVVDEIVIVDTGSTDASVSIAEAAGARVLHRPWDGDFSAARNYGLDHMRSEWILYIDADEYLAPVERHDVERWLGDPVPHIAYLPLLRVRPGATPFREYRVWRNHPRIRFWGFIHETHVLPIHELAQEEGLAISGIDLFLEHDGYEGDQGHKHERNLPLLLAQVQQDPGRAYLWDHIGRIHLALGRPDEARAAWEEGRQAILRRPFPLPADVLIYSDFIATNATEGRPDAALVEEADRLFPGNVAVLWSGALDAQARGAHEEVVDRLDRLLAVGADASTQHSVSMDEQIFAEWAFQLRAMARFQLGDVVGAGQDFATAQAAQAALAR
jgi:Glycosyl transferase family 2